MISAGQLNQRVTLQQRDAGSDALGQPLTTWTDVATVAADVRMPSGLETIRAGADVSILKTSIRIRWRVGVNAGMRAVHRGTVYDVRVVLPDPQRVFLDLVCEATQ